MKRFFILYFVSIVLAILFSCSDDSNSLSSIDDINLTVPEVSKEYDRDISTLVSTTNKGNYYDKIDGFSSSFFKNVINEYKDENVMVSPLSAIIALSLTANGAAGETLDSMLRCFNFGSDSLAELNSYLTNVIESLNSSDVNFQSANSIWCRGDYSPLKKSFYEVVTEYYLADIYTIDGADKINSWVDLKTNGTINEVVKDSDIKDAAMVLINALYLKADWENEFKKSNTSSEDFNVSETNITTVDMMFQNDDFYFKIGKNYRAVKLPYKDCNLSMYVYLPDDTSSLSEFYSCLIDGDEGYYTYSMNYDTWETEVSWVDEKGNIFSNFRKEDVNLYLPKFTSEADVPLKDILTNMGLGIAFNSISADFSNFVEGKNPYISKVLQKTFIDVNETGTEVVAATAVIMIDSTSVDVSMSQPFTMEVNRPFCYIIRDDLTNTNLLMGQMLNP